MPQLAVTREHVDDLPHPFPSASCEAPPGDVDPGIRGCGRTDCGQERTHADVDIVGQLDDQREATCPRRRGHHVTEPGAFDRVFRRIGVATGDGHRG
jgi:hypothetical protein